MATGENGRGMSMARGPRGHPAAERSEKMMLAALPGAVSLARDRAGAEQDGRGMSMASDQTDIPEAEMAEAMMLAALPALPGVLSMARNRAGVVQDGVLVEERRDSAGPRTFRAHSVNGEVPVPALDRWHVPAGRRRTDEDRAPDPSGTPPTKDVPGSSSTRAPSSSTQEEKAPEVRIAGLQLPQPRYEALKSAIIAEYLQGQHEESVDASQNLNWVSHVESGDTDATSVQVWAGSQFGSQFGVGEGTGGVRTGAKTYGQAATVYELDRERRRERERVERARFIEEGELVSLESPLVGCLVGSFSGGHKRASDECNERGGRFSLTGLAIDKMQGEIEEQLERWRRLQKDWETVTEYDSLVRRNAGTACTGHLSMVGTFDTLEPFDASLECAHKGGDSASAQQVMARLHQMESNLKAVSFKHNVRLDKTEHAKSSVVGGAVNFLASPIASRSERHGVARDAEEQDAVKEHDERVRVRSDWGTSMRARVRPVHKRFTYAHTIMCAQKCAGRGFLLAQP